MVHAPPFAQAKQLLLSTDFARSMLGMELNCHCLPLVHTGEKTVWRAELNCFNSDDFVNSAVPGEESRGFPCFGLRFSKLGGDTNTCLKTGSEISNTVMKEVTQIILWGMEPHTEYLF